MAIVSFSVPDDVKEAFTEAFTGQNKSAIIAALMLRAIDDAQRRRARGAAIGRLQRRRAKRPLPVPPPSQGSRIRSRVTRMLGASVIVHWSAMTARSSPPIGATCARRAIADESRRWSASANRRDRPSR